MKKRRMEKVIVLVVFLLLEVGVIAAIFVTGRHVEFQASFWRPWLGLIAGLFVVLYFLYIQRRTRTLQEHVIGEKVRTQTLIEALPDAVVVMDNENVIVALNAKAVEILGADATECIAEPLAKFFAGDTAQKITADFYGVLEAVTAGSSGTPPHGVKNHGQDAHATSEVLVKLRTTPILVDAKNRIGKVVLMEKAQREQAAPASTSAVEELSAMAAAVKVAQAGLAEAAAGIAKPNESFRNPLARALFLLEKVRFYFQDSSGELARASTEPGDFKRACEAALGAFEPLAKLKALQVLTEIAAQDYGVKGNIKALERALSEILLNAFSYTPSGGVITLRMQASDTHVRASILDSGVGIDRTELIKVFDRGFRGNNQMPDTAVGRGAGLTVARGIIEAHKGSVVIESERGRGTMVTVVLPRQ